MNASKSDMSATPPEDVAAEYDAAWSAGLPAPGPLWTARPWVAPAARAEEGKAARARVPRSSHAEVVLAPGRDPIAILEAQEADRLQTLVPLRHERMAESAFAYYRGTPAVMAFDLSTTPSSGIIVQASGDAHLSNFGLYASPERTIVFDANDFDETLPGPWEWDVKRLAASIVIAARANGFSAAQARSATLETVRNYRQWMGRYAGSRLLDLWYSPMTEARIREAADAAGIFSSRVGKSGRERFEAIFSKARQRDGMRAFEKLTAVVGGRRVILEDPPFVEHVQAEGMAEALQKVFADYRASMPADRRAFLERYRFVDFALKVVGVGSVGTRCYIVLLEGRDENDPLIMQAKEANASVLERYLAPSEYPHHGQRVVVGQQMMQAVSDIFLGWTTGPAGRAFFLRQLWDMKGSVDTSVLLPPGLGFYGGLCGWSLARTHAVTGDAVAIAAYLGTNDRFDGAIADFAEAYADVNDADYRAYLAAIDTGRVSLPAPTA
jgi:uncharacterized protein (DUF2252 family)